MALEHLRKNKPWVYQNGGLLPTNGEEWAKLRKMAQKPLADMTNFIKPIGNIADDFVAMLKTEKGNFEIVHFESWLKLFEFQNIGIFMPS